MIAPAVDPFFAINKEAHTVVGDNVEAVESGCERYLCSPAGRETVGVYGWRRRRPGAPIVVDGGLLAGESGAASQRAVVPVKRLPDDNGRGSRRRRNCRCGCGGYRCCRGGGWRRRVGGRRCRRRCGRGQRCCRCSRRGRGIRCCRRRCFQPAPGQACLRLPRFFVILHAHGDGTAVQVDDLGVGCRGLHLPEVDQGSVSDQEPHAVIHRYGKAVIAGRQLQGPAPADGESIRIDACEGAVVAPVEVEAGVAACGMRRSGE